MIKRDTRGGQAEVKTAGRSQEAEEKPDSPRNTPDLSSRVKKGHEKYSLPAGFKTKPVSGILEKENREDLRDGFVRTAGDRHLFHAF